MSDLQIAPPRERSVLPALLIAALVLAIVAAAVFWFNPRKTADLKVTAVETFAPHTELDALKGAHTHGMRVLGGDLATPEDDLYVLATVRLTDRLRLPLFITNVTAHVTFADGSEADTSMLSAGDLPRLESVFPALTPRIKDPISALDQELDPKQTLTGMVVLPFPGKTAKDWAAKKSATLTLELRNQDDQTTKLP